MATAIRGLESDEFEANSIATSCSIQTTVSKQQVQKNILQYASTS